MKKIILLTIFALVFCMEIFAQDNLQPKQDMKMTEKSVHKHEIKPDTNKSKESADEEKFEKMPKKEHKHDKEKPSPMKEDKSDEMPSEEMKEHKHKEMLMRSTVNIGDVMNREGSGTAWLPDSTPMHSYMKMYEDGGMLMVHGTMFLRYSSVGSKRDLSVAGKGSSQRFDAPSMFMVMYSRPISERSQLGLRAMLSLDPIIERGWGYPLLYQSGELYKGKPIHDRQHPHDFISELSASYSYKVNDKQSFYIYAGYPGEPALGPPAFVHRPSAANNPDAPIGHHWQDATHITYGVVTFGYSFGKVKVEASAFNGTEPDENRWAFDKPRLNSFSSRISWNPTKEWAFQVSYGYLRNPERSEPDLKVLRRTTASAVYNKKIGENKNWASTVVWAQNHSDHGRTNSFLFESDFQFQKNSVFGRFEKVQKNSHELVLPPPHPEENFWVGAYSLGYVRDIFQKKGINVGLGAMATINNNPKILVPFYGGTTHQSWQIFLRLRPSKKY